MAESSELKRGIYKHKNKFVVVYDVAIHPETLEEYVLYLPMALLQDHMFVVARSEFEEKILVGGKPSQRFQFVEALPELDEDEDEDDDLDDDEPELLNIFDNEFDLKQATTRLDKAGVGYDVKKQTIKPKPQHLASPELFKIFVKVGDFEEASEALGPN